MIDNVSRMRPSIDTQNYVASVLIVLAADMRVGSAPTAIGETGGDPGHAPARRTYEAAGVTKMPIARYFMVLE
jgi:hypothetical protein